MFGHAGISDRPLSSVSSSDFFPDGNNPHSIAINSGITDTDLSDCLVAIFLLNANIDLDLSGNPLNFQIVLAANDLDLSDP